VGWVEIEESDLEPRRCFGWFLTIAAKRAMEGCSRVAQFAPLPEPSSAKKKIIACFNISDGIFDAHHSPNMA
jgi:hypothetical protein